MQPFVLPPPTAAKRSPSHNPRMADDRLTLAPPAPKPLIDQRFAAVPDAAVRPNPMLLRQMATDTGQSPYRSSRDGRTVYGFRTRPSIGVRAGTSPATKPPEEHPR